MLILLVLFVGAYGADAASQLYNTKIIFHHKFVEEKNEFLPFYEKIFTSSSTMDSYELMKAESLLKNSNFDRSRPTVIYFHGYIDNSDAVPIKLLVSAYSNTNSFNILIFDWRELANSAYTTAVWNFEKLGIETANFIKNATTQGYDIKNWHLVGHSLGAHLAGTVGRHIKTSSNGSLILPRISGLDPAFPGFYILAIGPQPLSKSDASFVDVIHTDAGISGAPYNIATLDFWPNGGRRPQPGCSFLNDLVGCSHSRAVDLWIESVNDKGKVAFTARNAADPKIQAQMGLNCLTNSKPGSYNLSTNNMPPYSRA